MLHSKFIISTFIWVFPFALLYAQTLRSQTISSSGYFQSNRLKSVVGENAISKISNNNLIVYQGFLRPIEERVLGSSLQEVEILVYPNPTTESITIDSNTEILNAVKIYSSDGKIVIDKRKNLNEIDVKSLPSGVFIIEITTSNHVMRKKLLKKE